MQVAKPTGVFIACLIIMVSTIIWVQIAPLRLTVAWGLGLVLLGYRVRQSWGKGIRDTALLALNMLIGYVLYRACGAVIKPWFDGQEAWAIIVSRMSLLAFLLPFAVSAFINKTKPRYFASGQWGNTIYFPFILKGPVHDPIWRFLIIFTVITSTVFAFFIDWNQPDFFVLVGYAVAFAFINSILEELLWRGYILSSCVSGFGELRGLVIAGAAFGFYHYHLGFSWMICLLFSIFGMMMSGAAIRSQGLVPVIVMHMVMNILFVLSGMIL